MVYRVEIWYNSVPSGPSPTGCTLKILDHGDFPISPPMARIFTDRSRTPEGVTTGWLPQELEIGLRVVIT